MPLLALGLVVAGLFGARLWVNSYLRSADFRRMLDRQASTALRADGKFGVLQWQGTEVYNDAFDSVGDEASPLARLSAEQIRARLDLGALWHRAWRVEEIDVQRLGVTLAAHHPTPDEMPPVIGGEDSPTPEEPPAAETAPGPKPRKAERPPKGGPHPPPGFLAGWLPNRVEIGEVRIADFSLAWDADQTDTTGKLEHTRLSVRPTGEDRRTWLINGAEGRLTQTRLPPVTLKTFALRSAPHELFITRVSGVVEAGGQIELSGKQGLDGDRALDLNADFEALPLAAFLPKDWRARLKGAASGHVHVTGSAQAGQRAAGHLELHDGKLAAVPLLTQLATFTSSERYRQVPLQRASADFDWTKGDLLVKNLQVESEGLLRVEGGFTVRDNQMDGTLQVGVARSAVRWLATLGAQVFDQPEHDGYVWTTVRLTGPANHPSEDLSPRLIAAVQNAALKKAQQGTDAVLDTAKSLLDLLH